MEKMIVKVHPHKLEIEKSPVNEKQIDITKCEFVFDEEITQNYVKDVYFTLNDTTYKMANIQNNECDIPYEVLTEVGMVELGLVAYLVEDETEIKRYNPSPVYFTSWVGSLKSQYENTKPITPSDKEQFEQMLQDGLNDIAEAVEGAGNLDIDVSKVGDTATITITRQDETTKSVEIKDGKDGEDGADFEYNWVGTSLGVKTSEESDYQYVNLKGDTGEAGQIEFVVVNELPQEGVEGTIYLVPLEEPDTQGNNYAEYIWVNNAWELLGKIGVSVDLSGYYTKTETDNLLTNKVGFTDYADDGVIGAVKTNKSTYGIGAVNGTITPMYTTYSIYTSKGNSYAIAKGTLENVITGKGLIDNTVNNLVNYTTTTDMNTALGNKEDKSNKVTRIDSDSTDTQYPSAKCVYDIVGDIATTLDEIQREVI